MVQRCHLEAALGERIGLSDAEWEIVGALLPAERGRGCRPAQDNRRYRRWTTTGVFDAMLETLAQVVERDGSADMIDSTVVRAHHCAVGIRRPVAQAVGLPPSSTPDAMRKDARLPSS